MGERAIFEIGDATRVHTVWFVGGVDWDALAMVMREGDGPWSCTWRMRYDHGSDGKEGKNVHVMDPRPGMPVAEFVAAIDEVFRKQAALFSAPVERILIDGGAARLRDALIARPWSRIIFTGEGGSA